MSVRREFDSQLEHHFFERGYIMFSTIEERKTIAWHSNLNKSYKLRLAGPTNIHAEYLNIYFDHACYCLHKDDIYWLRDKLVERFPYPAPGVPKYSDAFEKVFAAVNIKKEEPRYKVKPTTTLHNYLVIETKIKEDVIATCTSIVEAEKIAAALNGPGA